MKKIFLTKTFFILVTVIGLSSCKNFIARFGAFNAMSAYYTKAHELFLKRSESFFSGIGIKSGTTAVADNSVSSNDVNGEIKEMPFIFPVVRVSRLPKGSWIKNYEGVKRDKSVPVLKGRQKWIICKPLFVRVRSEGYFGERNRVETLLERRRTLTRHTVLAAKF